MVATTTVSQIYTVWSLACEKAGLVESVDGDIYKNRFGIAYPKNMLITKKAGDDAAVLLSDIISTETDHVSKYKIEISSDENEYHHLTIVLYSK